jgi:FixJ family two-component response regulator
VIVMTAFADEAVCARVLQAGAAGFLKKPFDDSALVQCLAQTIERGETAKRGHQA